MKIDVLEKIVEIAKSLENEIEFYLEQSENLEVQVNEAYREAEEAEALGRFADPLWDIFATAAKKRDEAYNEYELLVENYKKVEKLFSDLESSLSYREYFHHHSFKHYN